MAEEMRAELQSLAADVRALAERVTALTEAVRPGDKPKDFWDKLSSLSSILSGMVLGIAGVVATLLFNSHQLTVQNTQETNRQQIQKERDAAEEKVRRMEVVEKFFQHLAASDERERSGAFAAIAVLDENLAVAIGNRYQDPAFTRVLISIRQDAPPRLQADATNALLGPLVKKRIESIVAVFEFGSASFDYGNVSIFRGDSGHLTYGKPQVTLASGNLFLLISAYMQRRDALYGARFAPFVTRLKNIDLSLDQDAEFRKLLGDAAQDHVMREVQDSFFDRLNWEPAASSAANLGINTPLGIAVIYDSFVHGSFRKIRDTTAAQLGGTPATGVAEKKWISTYVDNGLAFFKSSPNPLLQRTVYRPLAFKQLIEEGKWDLQDPITIRGVDIPSS